MQIWLCIIRVQEIVPFAKSRVHKGFVEKIIEGVHLHWLQFMIFLHMPNQLLKEE